MINKTSGSRNFFDLMHFIWVQISRAQVFIQTENSRCFLCIPAPDDVNTGPCWVVCVQASEEMYVGNGMSAPAVVSESIHRRLCARHVKFMFCAAFVKEPWNGF